MGEWRERRLGRAPESGDAEHPVMKKQGRAGIRTDSDLVVEVVSWSLRLRCRSLSRTSGTGQSRETPAAARTPVTPGRLHCCSAFSLGLGARCFLVCRPYMRPQPPHPAAHAMDDLAPAKPRLAYLGPQGTYSHQVRVPVARLARLAHRPPSRVHTSNSKTTSSMSSSRPSKV